eukprot:2429659-Rhodomonas_salina.4
MKREEDEGCTWGSWTWSMTVTLLWKKTLGALERRSGGGCSSSSCTILSSLDFRDKADLRGRLAA